MKEKEECNFEREEGVSRRSHSMFSAFLHQFWGGGGSTVHLIPCWAGAVQSRGPHGSAPPRIREDEWEKKADVGEWENKVLCNWQLFLK